MAENGKLVIISGSAGSGKGTVLKELFNLAEYKYSVSATTRLPRNGEADGVDYYFLTREDFEYKISSGDMLEHAEYSGNFYGTPRAPVEKMLSDGYNVILEIEVIGALNVKREFPKALMIFLSPPSYGELERRLRERGTETDEIIKKRLEIAKNEAKNISAYDYLVINETDKQKQSAFCINCIVEAEKYKDNLSNNSKKKLSKEFDFIFKIAEENKINKDFADDFLKKYFGN